jgi:hypothetical protein
MLRHSKLATHKLPNHQKLPIFYIQHTQVEISDSFSSVRLSTQGKMYCGLLNDRLGSPNTELAVDGVRKVNAWLDKTQQRGTIQ